MTLDEVPRGTLVRIAAVDWMLLADDEGKRLQALGIDCGTHVSVAHRGVFTGSDPIAVRIGSMTVALRRSHARAIAVEIV